MDKTPSGAALLSKAGKLISVAPSYNSFEGVSRREEVDWSKIAKLGESVSLELKATKLFLSKDPVSIVTIDMPVSKKLIMTRRVSDNIVTRNFSKAFF